MAQRVFIKLTGSEIAVLHAAAQIYSSYVIANKVEVGAQEKWIERSVSEAALLAVKVGAAVQSDREV